MKLEQLIEIFYANKLTKNILYHNTSKTEFIAFYHWVHDNFDELNLNKMLPNQIQALRMMFVGLCNCCSKLIDIHDIVDTTNSRWCGPYYWKNWELYDTNTEKTLLNYHVSGVVGTCRPCIKENKRKMKMKELKKNMKKSKCKQDDYCCPICMDDIEKETHQIRLKCKHAFHPTCISEWTTSKSTCPCCRSDIIHI